ncbi:DegT/DnrJ/EryC1/StrS family aminotransferase [Natrinema marinum]|uniref:DegT/DnrJ/EryC1/StrS family aminotransferase n=1 Tax=Natrinema marinum TaxID=2961598 RepID=UPI0020C8AE63|nr:DegT/DnrJ/EryC1/StrS family aminotransferase [Natrinema marinum]
MIPIASPELGKREVDRVSSVIESGMLADGDEVRAFEREFADYCGVERGVATANGTAALHAALEAVGIGAGDRVLTTPFSFVATANAIRHAGAEPLFADIDPITYNLDPGAAREIAESKAIDAILVVHLYGLPAEMDAFVDLADDLEVPLIEDCAQAHGATYRGDRVGSFGDAACFSFYPTKNMTTGEGGIVLTDRREVADRAGQYVDHGRTDDGTHATLGHNFRLTNLAAAIGRAQLERLPRFVERRRENATRLSDGLAGTDLSPPTEPSHARHVYHQYTVRSPDRRALRDHLAAHDIGAGVYYSTPIHEEPAYGDVSHDAPAAERAAAEVLSLPVHPNVSPDEIDRITEVIADYAA